MEKSKQHLSSTRSTKAFNYKSQDNIICKVKFSAFSVYENVCFLPNKFEELVKVFSKAFYPNDFCIVYLNSKFSQMIVHSDETYNDILSDIYQDDKTTREAKFQIILYNGNNDIEFNLSKERISNNIKTIFEQEKNIMLQMSKANRLPQERLNQSLNSMYRSIEEESEFSFNKNKVNSSFETRNSDINANSCSLSCKNVENYKILDMDFKNLDSSRDRERFEFNGNISNSYSEFGKTKKSYKNFNLDFKYKEGIKNNMLGKGHDLAKNSTPDERAKHPFKKDYVFCC